MTSPLAVSRPTSVEQKALSDLNTKNKTFVNRDFTKNIAFLNQTADVHTAFLSKLQKGVDDANMNVVEKIQGFAADLFILFAGGEPTGIELGDVKYIFQAIGALLGINPETPFPLNLVEAALNLLEQFIIPLPQFTDVIFDSIVAWAIDFGLPQDFIDSLHDLQDAILGLGAAIPDLFDAIKNLLGAFGFFDWETGLIGALWDGLIDLLDLVPWDLLGGVLGLLADLGTPFINALTWIINTGANLLGFISGDQIQDIGENVAPAPANNTTIWQVGVDPVTTWIFDGTQSATTPTASGSFKTNGSGTNKRMLTQGTFPCATGQKFLVKASIKWTGIPTAANDVGLALVFFNGNTEDSQLVINIAAGHGTTGGWATLPATEVVVPDNVDNFKIALRIGNSINTGQVWIDDISVQRLGKVSLNILEGFWDVIEGFIPIEFFKNLFGLVGGTLNDIGEWFLDLLHWDSPISASNIVGTLASIPLAILGIGNRNLLANPTFEGADSLQGGGEWEWDGTVRHSTRGGSAKGIANAFPHELYSNLIPVEPEENIEMIVRAKWVGLTATGTPIALWVKGFDEDNNEIVAEVLESVPAPPANTDWVELSGEYVVPDGVEFVCMSCELGATATAGTIWFSNGSMEKKRRSGVFPLDMTDGLLGIVSSLDDFTQYLVDTFLEIVDGIPIIGGSLADFFEKVFDWFEDTLAAAAQAADAFFNAIGLNKLFSRIFGTTESSELAAAEEAVVALNGRIVALEGGGVVSTYTVTQVWNNPSPLIRKRVKVIVVNGGDGGARANIAYRDNPKGGMSGGYIEKDFWTDELPATVMLTIGAGGSGSTSGGVGFPGQISSFGSLLVGIKGIGAVYNDGARLPDKGVPPGKGGNGVWTPGSNDNDVLIPSTDGEGGPFAPGGKAGFGNDAGAVAGKDGADAPVNIPSGGGGGGGGSVSTGIGVGPGKGGNGGFPGGAGGAGAKYGVTYNNGGNGAQGAIFIVTED